MMNRLLRWHLLFVLFISASVATAQIVGDDAFMQGNFAEVGVNGCGAFASSTTPPDGFVETGLSGLNFVADSDMDGWDVGDPNYCGDYAVPGSPVEGWGIQIDGANYYNTDQGCFTSDIDGEVVSWSDDGDSIEIIWEGNVAGITVTQRSVLYDDALYFVTYITLTNESGDDLTDVYYRRNIDPDNEQLATGSFVTINTVESNPYLGDAAAIVTAVGQEYGCYLALVANNLFSNGSHGNFGTTSGTSVSSSYLGTDGFNLEGTNTADQAIQMSFWVPALPNGGSTTFAFAYVFSEDAVEDALEDTYIPGDEPTDVGIISFEAPSSGCGLGSEDVTVKIFNYGFEAASDIPVSYQVDGGSVVTETFVGPLDPGTFGTHTFGTAADLSAEGDYTITAWTSLDGDTTYFNDTSDIAVSNIPVISSFPYIEDFEGGSSGWLSGGTNSSWELGYPSASVIDGPPPSTPSSEESWATSLFDFYNINEDSWVQSPCFDFTDLVIPYVKFDIWWETYEFWDGARLEYSLDAGDSWEEIGGIGTGENWYTPGGCYSFGYDPITFSYFPAWEGSGGEWKTAKHDISFLAGESQVQFRIHFKSYVFEGFSDGIAFDNFFVGDPFPNDVGVIDVVEPMSGPSLTDAETITVEVKNFGSLSQTGFPVSFQVDGGSVITETFTDVIEPGTVMEFTFAGTADMSLDGDYEVCSWTGLVGDEDISNDSICKTVSNLLPVTGTDAYYIYSNSTGGEPWFTTSNSEAMDAVYPDGWTQDFFETVDPAEVFSEATCFVFLEGSDSHALELEEFLDDNLPLIEAWVASGGHLFLNAAPNEGDGMDFGFDGVELDYSWFTYNVEAFVDDHPIFEGPFTPVGTAWSGGSFGHARLNGEFDTLITDAFGIDNVVCAEKAWGAGTVIFGGMTSTSFHSPLEEAFNLRANIIAYLSACTVSDIDLGLTSIITPDDGCGLGEEEVTVKIRNYGFEPQTDIPVNYQVDGGAITSEIWLGTLDPGESVEYTFAALADLTALGEYEIVAWTSFAGDTILSNDTADAIITNIPVISSFPYFEDYEDGAAGWITDGGDLWELGSPAGATIDGPPDTDPDSENSWMTDLDGEYPINSDAWVQSPCFDFTDLVLPFVRFDIWWDTYEFWDGARLEYSTDAGATWDFIGDIGTGDNWYTDGGCYSFGFDPLTGFYYPAWEGPGGSWKTAQHDVSFLAGETQVQFRMHFKSYAFTGFSDGVAFDNFYISDPFGDDIGVTAILSPSSGADLTGDEEVTVEIENFGTNTQSDFPVSFQVDGGTVVTETYPDELEPGEVVTYTFATGGDFAAYGPHDICAWTGLDADEDVSNDSICKPVTNFEFISYYIYSDWSGAEPWFTTANSEAMDAVFADAWLEEFFETADPETVFSDGTCMVFLEGSDSHANELEDFLADNIELIEDWVEAGGRLFLNAAPNEGDGMDFGFDGTELVYSWYTGTAEAYDEDHPVFEGPFTPVGTSWSASSFGHARLEGDFDTLIVDAFTPDYVVAAEKAWGDGVVIFGGMTTTNFHSPLDEAFNLRANIISYLSICETTTPVDLAMLAMTSPESGCGLGAETVTVEIENLSGVAVTGVEVSFSVDGGTPVTETILDDIDAFSTYTYTFTATADLSATGDHTIETSVDFPGDIDPLNDALSTTVSTFETPVVDLPANGTFCDELELDAGNPGSIYLWSTGATTQEIIVTESGTYSVTVTNPTTGCTATDVVEVTMEFSPVASFTYTATGLDVTFTNTSTGGASYSWNFGDGETSSEDNPDHSYASPGLYNVTLTVSNGCGNDVYTTQISVATSIEDQLSGSTQIYPNPTSGLTVVSVDFDAVYELNMEIVNQLGQVVWSNIAGGIQNETFEVDLSEFADGVYTLKVQAGDHRFSKSIILTK